MILLFPYSPYSFLSIVVRGEEERGRGIENWTT